MFIALYAKEATSYCGVDWNPLDDVSWSFVLSMLWPLAYLSHASEHLKFFAPAENFVVLDSHSYLIDGNPNCSRAFWVTRDLLIPVCRRMLGATIPGTASPYYGMRDICSCTFFGRVDMDKAEQLPKFNDRGLLFTASQIIASIISSYE